AGNPCAWDPPDADLRVDGTPRAEQEAQRIRLPIGVERDDILRGRAPVKRVAQPEVWGEGREDDEDDHDADPDDSDAALFEERPSVREVPSIGPKAFLRQVPIDHHNRTLASRYAYATSATTLPRPVSRARMKTAR